MRLQQSEFAKFQSFLMCYYFHSRLARLEPSNREYCKIHLPENDFPRLKMAKIIIKYTATAVFNFNSREQIE